MNVNYLGVDACVADADAIKSFVETMPEKKKVIISFDTESSNNTMIEVGFVVFVREPGKWVLIQKFSACCDGLSLDPDEKTNAEFWCKFSDQFERIAAHSKPLEGQVSLIVTLLTAIARRSESVKFLARPAAYDFHVMSVALEKYRAENPLGFGGTAKLICAGNAVNAHARAFGVENPPSFESLVRRFDMSPVTHSATDDALCQARTFFAVEDTVAFAHQQVELLLENQPCSIESVAEAWRDAKAALAPETDAEIQLSRRRDPPTEAQKREFGEAIERLKKQRIE